MALSNNGIIFHVSYILPLLLVPVLILTGCDDSFQPFQENPRHPFTINGYLDASIDTNWVRVTPVRNSLYLEKDTRTDAEVTLEHLESGEIAVMKDSLFQLDPFREVFALNWWTSMQLEPGHSYRLTAKLPDGRFSRVKVTLPETFPEPVITVDSPNYEVYLEGIPNLADATVNYHVEHFSEHYFFKLRHLQDTVRWAMPPGHHQFNFNPTAHLTYISEYFDHLPHTILNRWIYIASAGPEWIHFPDIDDRIIELPDGVTNVEGGAGYLIGIVSKTIEF